MTNKMDAEGIVTGLASEGQGIVRKHGFVTFVPFTVPGDIVLYKNISKKKNFAVGKLLNIVLPSQDRINPVCRYYGLCGGCQLQHIRYGAQAEYKRQWVEDALKKIGKFQMITVPPLIKPERQWAYRRRIQLVLKPFQDVYQAGYIAADNRSLVPIGHCPIFIDEDDPIIQTVQEISGRLKNSGALEGKVEILKSKESYILHFHFRNMPKNSSEILSMASKASPLIAGILAASTKKTIQFGKIETSCRIADLEIKYTTKTFVQNHPEQSLKIYQLIENFAKEMHPRSVLDLYCGIGISSLLVARLGCKVKGIELNPHAIELAQCNAKNNGITHAEFLAADVENVLEEHLNDKIYDFIIVNPPREGLSPKVTSLLMAKPAKTLIYISCMPSTLARDLMSLCQTGYKLASIQAFDMFPQTVHVETVVVLHAS